jgi:hypothetical protein
MSNIPNEYIYISIAVIILLIIVYYYSENFGPVSTPPPICQTGGNDACNSYCTSAKVSPSGCLSSTTKNTACAAGKCVGNMCICNAVNGPGIAYQV